MSEEQRSGEDATPEGARQVWLNNQETQFQLALGGAFATHGLMVASVDWPAEYWAYLSGAYNKKWRLEKLAADAKVRKGFTDDSVLALQVRAQRFTVYESYPEWFAASNKLNAAKKLGQAGQAVEDLEFWLSDE